MAQNTLISHPYHCYQWSYNLTFTYKNLLARQFFRKQKYSRQFQLQVYSETLRQKHGCLTPGFRATTDFEKNE